MSQLAGIPCPWCGSTVILAVPEKEEAKNGWSTTYVCNRCENPGRYTLTEVDSRGRYAFRSNKLRRVAK